MINDLIELKEVWEENNKIINDTNFLLDNIVKNHSNYEISKGLEINNYNVKDGTFNFNYLKIEEEYTTYFNDCKIEEVLLKLNKKNNKIIFKNCTISTLQITNIEFLKWLVFENCVIHGTLVFENQKAKENKNNKNKIKLIFESCLFNNSRLNVFNLPFCSYINIYKSYNFTLFHDNRDNTNIKIEDSEFSLKLISFETSKKEIKLNISKNNIIKSLSISTLLSINTKNIEKYIDISNCKILDLLILPSGFLDHENNILFIDYILKNNILLNYYDIYKNDSNDIISIGCKERTIKQWDRFFSNRSKEVFSTPRNSLLFKFIKKEYQIFKIKYDL